MMARETHVRGSTAALRDPYTQCVLERANRTTTSWLPQRFSRIGKILKLKREDGTWEDGWQVKSTGTTMEFEYVLNHERDYKNQRKASDI